MGTLSLLQALGSVIATFLFGILKETFPVTMRQRQSVPLAVSSLRDWQQAEVGEPEPLLFMKFIQGPKLRSIALLHAVLICPETCVPKIINTMAKHGINRRKSIKNLNPSIMIFFSF